MKIKFLKDVELEIVTDCVNDRATTENETFRAGDETEIDICDGEEIPNASEIQFGDGSVSFVTPDFWAAVSILG